ACVVQPLLSHSKAANNELSTRVRFGSGESGFPKRLTNASYRRFSHGRIFEDDRSGRSGDTFDLLFAEQLRGVDHDGNIARRGIGRERFEHFIPRHARHLEIEEDRARMKLARELEALLSILGLDRRIAFGGENIVEDVASDLAIVDNQEL